jgi:hypothetical protein
MGRIGACSVLVGKPEGQRPLERPRCRKEEKIKQYQQKVGSGTRTGLIWPRIGTGGGTL